jgi:two-component system chemotaxis sensor kinase CheA
VSIILTGYADKQNAIRFINELDIYYYLEKPWDNDALIKIIENGLEKRDLEKELDKRLSMLEDSNRELSGLYSLLKTDYNKEISKVEALNEWNRTLETAVHRSTSSLRNLLDNAGQGFLTFGEDLTVHKEYSYECSNIFGGSVAGSSFGRLIYPEDEEQQRFIKELVPKILTETDQLKREVLLSLLPDEFCRNGKYITAGYKLIEYQSPTDRGGGSRAVMAILTDITEKRSLEIKMQEEQSILRMIVKAVTNRSDFLYCINSYKDFCLDKLGSIISDGLPPADILSEIFRNVHNFKGNFSQLDFMYTVKELHDCESRLTELKNTPESFSPEQLKGDV